MNTALMFSSKSDHYSTPVDLYNSYMDRGYVDPCPLYCETDNLLADFGNVKLFINPPYSNINKWVEFAIRHHTKYGNEIVLLVPSRTDTKWFHRLLEYGVHLDFIKGRLKFGDSKNTAPFPSVLIKLK